MTIPLLNSGHGLMEILGRWAGGLDDINAIRGTLATGGIPTARVLSGALWTSRVTDLIGRYNSAVQQISVDGIYSSLTAWQNASAQFLTVVQQESQRVLINMANTDNPLVQQTLVSALALLVTQMTNAAQTVQSSTVAAGAATAVGTPHGNPVWVTSAKDGNGLGLQYTIPETITLTCTVDSQSQATSLNTETFSVTSPVAEQNFLAADWPLGSGLNSSLNLVDASKNNASNQVINNGDFETFSGSPLSPNNWTIAVGTAGVNVFQGSAGNSYTGSSSLQITLDAVPTQTELRQQFNLAGGTLYKLLPATQYALSVWTKVSAAPGAGSLILDLFNGTSIVNDNQGVANSVTITLSGQTATYANTKAVFRTPNVLPATAYLRVRLSGAVGGDSGKNLFVDRLGFTPMTQFTSTSGGIFLAGFSANTAAIKTDAYSISVTNSWGLLQRFFRKVWGSPVISNPIPNSGSPTVADSLIS